MIRVLVIITVTGFVLCVACLAGAAALGGRDIAKHGWSVNNWLKTMDITVDGDDGDVQIRPAVGGRGSIVINDGGNIDHGQYNEMWSGSDVTRTFDWTGGGEIDLGMPADIIYTQGPAVKITVTGPSAAVDRFEADGKHFRLKGWNSSNTFHGRPSGMDINNPDKPPRLKIEVTAPGVTRFDLSGTETVVIRGYDQDSLDLDLSGSSSATVSGKARIATLDLSGAANADLAGLDLQDAIADLNGGSQAVIGPKASAILDVGGGSKVRLTTRPARMVRDTSNGAVIEEMSSASPSPSPSPSPSKSASKAR